MCHTSLSIGLFGFNKWGRFFRGIRLAQAYFARLLIWMMLIWMMLIWMSIIRLRSLFRRTFAGIWLQLLFGQLLDHGGRL